MTTDPRAALTPRRVLWLALVAVLAASWSHVAGAFGTLEHGGAPAFLLSMAWLGGPLAAVALDLGIVGLSWGIGAAKRAGRDTKDLWVGVGVFAGLSALANFDHALSVLGHHAPYAIGAGQTGAAAWFALDWYERVKVIALSATLPIMAIYLTRVVETAANEGRAKAKDDDTDDAGTEDNEFEDTDQPPADLDPVTAYYQDMAAIAHPAQVNGHAGHPSPVGVIQLVKPQDTQPPKPRPVAGQGQAKLTPARYAALYREHVPAGTGHQEADRIVAARAKVSTKTAQRARLASDNERTT